jgi:hypothetical protein
MNLLKSCVSVINVYNAIQRTVISVSVHRFLPVLYRLQLFDLVCCPLRGKIVSEQYMSCDGPTAAPHLLCRWCSTHLAVILHIFKSCHNIHNITNPEIFLCSANSFTVQCLSYPHTAPLWLLTHLNKQTKNVNHDAFQKLTHIHLWMHVPTMKMFVMGWYNHPVLHVALHGTLTHFYLGEWLFSHTLCAVDLILKWKSVTCQSCWHVKCTCTPTYIYIYITHTHTT